MPHEKDLQAQLSDLTEALNKQVVAIENLVQAVAEVIAVNQDILSSMMSGGEIDSEQSLD